MALVTSTQTSKGDICAKKRLPQGTQNFKLIAWSDVMALVVRP